MEKELKKLGFKKKWLSDRSSYWFEKPFKLKDIKFIFIIQLDPDKFELDIYDDSINCEETVKSFKCDLKTIKQKLTYYTT